MTPAERQAAYRERQKAGAKPVKWRSRADHRSRPQRWADAVQELLSLQEEYRAWLAALPEGLATSSTADALQAIDELDLGELADITPPKGYGRD